MQIPGTRCMKNKQLEVRKSCALLIGRERDHQPECVQIDGDTPRAPIRNAGNVVVGLCDH